MTLILVQNFFVKEAHIKLSIPIFPPGDVFVRKFIQGWHSLDYHHHYFAFFITFLIFGYVSLFKQSGFVAKMEHEGHDMHAKHDDHHAKHEAKAKQEEKHSPAAHAADQLEKDHTPAEKKKPVSFSLLYYLRTTLYQRLFSKNPEPAKLKEE